MSFTIKCNECGNEQTITDDYSDNDESVRILVYGSRDQDITIRCTNKDCSSWVLFE